MTDLKLIPKPEGFELRDKRSDKTRSGCDWEPRDALYNVFKAFEGKEIQSLMIIYREVLPDGQTQTMTSFAGLENSGESLLLTGMGRFMQWEKK